MTPHSPERFSQHNPEDGTGELPTRLPLGEGAVRAAFTDNDPLKINGVTLYEATFQPAGIDGEALHGGIDALAALAVEKNLLSEEEAENLRDRLKGLEAPELPEEYASGKDSMQRQLIGLVRDHPGDMNNEPPERRRHALAMKGLLHKFLGDPRPNSTTEAMSVAEIQEWVAGVGVRNSFSDIDPDTVPVMLVGGFDAVFRRAPARPLAR